MRARRGLRRGCALAVALAFTSPAASPDPVVVEDLGWLAGCWARSDAAEGSGEQWMAPAGGTVLGMSRTVRDGRTAEYEFVVIQRATDGVLVYHARPSGQAATEFRLLRLNGREVVFENPAHDFPQRVGYRLQDDGGLLAWIEGTRSGKTRRVEFHMRRAACGEASPPVVPERR